LKLFIGKLINLIIYKSLSQKFDFITFSVANNIIIFIIKVLLSRILINIDCEHFGLVMDVPISKYLKCKKYRPKMRKEGRKDCLIVTTEKIKQVTTREPIPDLNLNNFLIGNY